MALKAAPEDQALLLELQDLDTRVQRLDNQLRNLPETAQLVELEREAMALRRTLAEQTGTLEDAQAELGRVPLAGLVLLAAHNSHHCRGGEADFVQPVPAAD